MNIIYLLLQKSWRIVLLASIASLVSGIFSTVLIALINQITNDSISLNTNLLNFIQIVFMIVCTSIISQILLTYLSQTTICKLRLFLSNQIMNSPLQQIELVGSHRLLATFSGDVQAISYASTLIPSLFTDIAILISCLIYLLSLNLIIFSIVFAVLIVGLFSYQLLEAKANQALALAREQEDTLYKHFQGLINGIKELKLHYHRRQAFLNQEIKTTAKSCQNKNIKGNIIFAIAEVWGRTLFFVTIGVIIFVIPLIINIETQQLAYYVLIIIFLTRPIESIINTLPALTKASIALKKIDSLGLVKENQISDKTINDDNLICEQVNQLEINNLSYQYYSQYQDSNFNLGPINLNLNAGEIVFFVGGNGSGKSTLAKLITGLYIPENGAIKLNDNFISDENRDWYRQHFSAIFSDFYLFDKLLGLQSTKINSQIQDYLIKLNLHEKVDIKNGCLSTTALSTGQRKRLALLTAYLEDRPIYLFDEWASDQDPIFREIFYTQILQELKNNQKTVLVISHDDKYFHLADRIVKLDYGQLQNIN